MLGRILSVDGIHTRFKSLARTNFKSIKIKAMYYTETITIKKTYKGYFYKKFDDEDNKYQRISKSEAVQSIQCARENEMLITDDNIESDYQAQWTYWN